MLTNFIWWSSIAIEVAILLRGAHTGLLKKYPLFHGYVACVLGKEIIGVLTNAFKYDWYEPSYWPAELITILASYAVIFEIFRVATRYNPGVRRLTRNSLLIVFALAASFAASDFAHGGFASFARAIADLGRDLRYVEAGILLVMLWLFTRYKILFGRNTLGLLVGYSFWVGLNVVNLAFWFQRGNESSVLLRTLLPATYVVTLALWCAALWRPQAELARPVESDMERDYLLLAARTQAVLARTLARLVRMIKP